MRPIEPLPTAGLPPCALCGGATRPLWTIGANRSAEPGTGSYTLCWCDRSRFGQIHPRPTAEQSVAFHTAAFFNGESLEAATRTAPLIDRARVAVAYRLDRSRPLTPESVHAALDARPARIIDVGCGNGEVLAGLKRFGHDVLGIEPAEPARRLAEALGVKVIPGTADEPVGLEPGTFDVVIARHSLEHCTDPVQAFRNMVNLVRPGGRLFCATPNCDSLGFRLSAAAWWHTDVPRHLHFFTAQSLITLCERFGLEVLGVEHYGFVRQFTPGWIRQEQKAWDRMFASGGSVPAHHPRRPSSADTWLRLARTLWSADSSRYDSVKVIARRPSTLTVVPPLVGEGPDAEMSRSLHDRPITRRAG